ncbi:hypothetical protein I4U23_002145 [Adineta vaga]|nr:hypothetical protein I4U23_002145 [Adineta vaga]
MPKRKNDDVNAEDEDDETISQEKSAQQQQQQQPPQKVYDFHKKTIEVYPPRLLELNRQFVASISSQVEAEQYSVLVGNCLDYVRQYFTYEDDLLQYSPWLQTRLKQSRSDIVKCLQETIDVYEALARHDFDHIIDKNSNGISADNAITNKTATSVQSTTSSFQFHPITATTTTSSSSVLNFPKTTTTTTATTTPNTAVTTTNNTTSFSFTKTATTTTTANSDSVPSTNFSFSKTASTESSTLTTAGFSFSKSSSSTAATTTTSDTLPTTGFTFSKPLTAIGDSSPSTGFSFKLPAASTSPEKATNPSPFAFNIPSTGFGTSTFSSPFSNLGSAEKTSTSSASSISFAPPLKLLFGSTPVANTEQQGTGDDNDDETSEPPEPEKVEHETDAKLTYRCRMGVKKGDKLIKRGPVQAILKETNGKHQLIIRSDDTLGRLYLNILWCKPIEVKKHSAKDLTFVCQINPGMPEVKEGDLALVLLRFDNENDRNDAHDKLNKELQ